MSRCGPFFRKIGLSGAKCFNLAPLADSEEEAAVDAKVRDHNLHRVESRKDVLDSKNPEKKTIRRMPWLHVPAPPDLIRETSWSRAMCMAMKFFSTTGFAQTHCI